METKASGVVRAALGVFFCCCAGVLPTLGTGCGESDECGALERLCHEQCTSPETRRECAEIFDQDDQDLCEVWYEAFAKRCPAGFDFSDDG